MALFVFAAALLLRAQTQTKAQTKAEEPPYSWSVEKIRNSVDHVRAGRDLTPAAWPRGCRVAVGLSFDFDAETNALRDGLLSPGVLSQGEYAARAALPRILALLDRYRLPATFFVPAVTALLHREEMAGILASGRHEIGMHGWIHERNSQLSEAEERRLMRKSYELLKSIMGKPPAGIRTPSWDFSLATLRIIRELGLLYDSSLMADDRPYEILADGRPTGVVELPVEWLLDDYPYFGFDRYSAVRPHMTPKEVYEIWKAEFDQAYREGTMLILTMHPKYIGHRSRIAVLEKLIRYIISRGRVWFATHEDIARVAAQVLQPAAPDPRNIRK
ncbi:MAG: polysaccharide deacetylase [Candidatus Aminicenantes bacterium]|nr:polysaccharide deacetylase [Candidatus Aminicenantes bacterium]